MKRSEPNFGTRGGRLAFARRLLGAAQNRDLSREGAAKLIGGNGQTWGRWEEGEDRWRDDTLEKLVGLFRKAGLEWVTPAWLDHGYGEAPQIVTPRPPVTAYPTAAIESEPELAIPQADEERKRRRRAKGA